MSYDYSSANATLELPNPYRVQNKLLFACAALMGAAALFTLFEHRQSLDPIAVAVGLGLLFASVVTAATGAKRLRFFFGRGRPASLAPELPNAMVGTSDQASTIKRILRDGALTYPEPYAFARFEFWGKKLLFSIMVGTMMLPLIVLRLPQYLMFRELGWLDTYLPLILPSAFATDTFFVFMLVQFLRGIPRDMEEAAMIDGCNALQLLWHIIVPLLKPAIISVVVFQFIWTMNDFMGPLIYLASVEKYPVSLALKMSIGATEEVEWANVIAISVVALVPSVAVFFAAQKHFIEGAASSGIKG